MADAMVGAAETAEEYRRRKMMQAMLEKGATDTPKADPAGPMSVAQPLGQIANAAAAAFGPNAQAPALAPMPADGVGPPALAAAGGGGGIAEILKKLMSGMGG